MLTKDVNKLLVLVMQFISTNTPTIRGARGGRQ